MGVQFVKSKIKLNFKKEKPTVYKIQQVNYGVVETEALIDDVAEACGLNRAMTKAALEGIVSRVCRYIGMGHAVQLGELGTVKPYFTAKTKETADVSVVKPDRTNYTDEQKREFARKFGLPEKEVEELIRNSDGVYETAPLDAEEEHDIFRENEL